MKKSLEKMDTGLPPITQFFPPPNMEETENLTEYERMIRGLPYRHLSSEKCKEISDMKKKCIDLLDEFNKTASNDNDRRSAILKKLLHPSHNEIRNIWIKAPFICSVGVHLKLGHNFFANNDCYIYDTAPIEFGNDCKLGPGVHIYTPTHPVNAAYRLKDDVEHYYEQALPVKIGHNCWLGGRSVICPGVTLGDNVVVGAGAVVTKSFPSNVVIAGNPAKVIRHMPPLSTPKNPVWKD